MNQAIGYAFCGHGLVFSSSGPETRQGYGQSENYFGGKNRFAANPRATAKAAVTSGPISYRNPKLYEPRFTGFDDQTLIYPLQLNNRLAAMQNYLGGDAGPTEQAQQVLAQLSSELDQEFAKLKHALDVDLSAFNSQLKTAGLPAITVSSVARTTSPE